MYSVSDCRSVEHISCIVLVTADGWAKQNKYPASFLMFIVGLSASLVGSSLAKSYQISCRYMQRDVLT